MISFTDFSEESPKGVQYTEDQLDNDVQYPLEPTNTTERSPEKHGETHFETSEPSQFESGYFGTNSHLAGEQTSSDPLSHTVIDKSSDSFVDQSSDSFDTDSIAGQREDALRNDSKVTESDSKQRAGDSQRDKVIFDGVNDYSDVYVDESNYFENAVIPSVIDDDDVAGGSR